MTSMREAIPKQCPKHSSEQCKSSNARTYVRYSQTTSQLTAYLTFGNARRGAARFHLTRIRNAPNTDAPRCPIEAATHA